MGIFGRDDTTRRAGVADGEDRTGQAVQPDPRDDGDRTVIAAPVHIKGDLTGPGQILVHGKVTGKIDGSGSVRIEARGTVAAVVHGRSVVVAGSVTGDITADERIELEPSAKVDGDITAPRILIREGATFRGQVNMRTPAGRSEAKKSGDNAGDKAAAKG